MERVTHDPAQMSVPRGRRRLFLATRARAAAIAPLGAAVLRAEGVDTATIGVLGAVAALAAVFLVRASGHPSDVMVVRLWSGCR